MPKSNIDLLRSNYLTTSIALGLGPFKQSKKGLTSPQLETKLDQ